MGIDLGGSKIEGVAIADDGEERASAASECSCRVQAWLLTIVSPQALQLPDEVAQALVLILQAAARSASSAERIASTVARAGRRHHWEGRLEGFRELLSSASLHARSLAACRSGVADRVWPRRGGGRRLPMTSIVPPQPRYWLRWPLSRIRQRPQGRTAVSRCRPWSRGSTRRGPY